MDNDFSIGFALIWCAKYIFIPLGVAIIGRILSEKLLRLPKQQRKKRLIKNRLK